GRLEPARDGPPRHHVLLKPQRRDEKAVDDVVGGPHQPDDFAHRYVQFVFQGLIVGGAELAVGTGIGELPVELLALDVNGLRGRRQVDLDLAPDLAADLVDAQVEHQDYQHRDQDPGGLPRGVAADIHGLGLAPAAIADDEIEDQSLDRNEPHREDVVD